MNRPIRTLPAQLAIPGLTMGPTSAPHPRAREGVATLSVLLIDDSSFMRDVAVETLDALGVSDIHCAADGRDALDYLAAAKTPPDVIVCDLEMPCMDGLEFIRHLGSRAYRGAILLISGHSERLLGSASELVRSLELRLAGAMRKPLDPSILANLLDTARLAVTETPATRASTSSPSLSADEVRAGFAAGSVEVMLQPQVSVSGHRIVGFEALLRWRDARRGFVAPTTVVASAEAAGLIDELTYRVFRLATQALARIHAVVCPVSMSVNLSVENLAQLRLPETLRQIASENGIAPQHLVLEVTENRLIGNLAASLEVLGRLSLGGFRLAMDDFGTGYATLEMLKKLPFDELKIDRSFVSGAAHDMVTRTILRSSIDLGRALGMTVVAEGIETLREHDLIVALGAEVGQGYYYAKPMTLDEALRWLNSPQWSPVAVA